MARFGRRSGGRRRLGRKRSKSRRNRINPLASRRPEIDLLESRLLLAGDLALEDDTFEVDVSVAAEVVDRLLFYNNSAFDGNDPAANALDDNAIATDKQALLPGELATFANYSSYSRGTNGIIVDVDGLLDPGAISAADFEFQVGNVDDVSSWTEAPPPLEIDVRPGEGTAGADRITITWADNAIQQEWLEVKVLATTATGLSKHDVFYFGSAIGETGNSASDAIVNATDEIDARNNPHFFFDPADLEDPYDFNRDTRVNATDEIIARNHQTFFLNDLNLIDAPENTEPVVTVSAGNFLELTVGEIEFITSEADSDVSDPVAILRDVNLTFTELPDELGSVSITLSAIDGYDDNGDGLIDGFGLSTAINIGDVDLSVGDTTLLRLAGLSLGVSGLEIRPELSGGFRTGQLSFDADDVQLLPGGLSLDAPEGDDPLSFPGIGSIDINSGAFSLDVAVPAAISQSLTLSGWVPLRLTRVEASYDPGETNPAIDFAVSGFVDSTQLTSELGTAIGSPNLAVTVERYDEPSTSFVPLSQTNPLRFGVAYVDNEIRLTDTPPLKVDVENIEFDLGSTLGSVELDGFIAVGGFDDLGLPNVMPTELGSPFGDEQVVGQLTVDSTSGLGNITGQITLGGNLSSTDGITDLSLTGTANLNAQLGFTGVTASGALEADFNWDLQVDHTTGQPSFSGLPQLVSVEAQDVLIDVADLLTLDVASIQYFDPATLTPGDPVAALNGATLTFTDLPGDFAQVATLSLGNLDGYDDNGDGLIDGFGLSTSINIGDVDLSVGDTTLLTLAGLSLGVSGLEIRPELSGGFRTGQLSFDADDVQLLPGGLSLDAPEGDDPLSFPGIGSIDINSGAFSLDVAVPAAISQSLTLSGWVPLRLTRVEASYDPGQTNPAVDFAVSGFVDSTQLTSELGTAIGSPNLAVSVEHYDEQSTSFVPLSQTNPLRFGVAYVDNEIRLTDAPPLKVDVENFEFDLGTTLGSVELDGFIAVGGFDDLGLPNVMPTELGPPFGDEQVVGELTVDSTSGLGNITGQITLGGNLSSTDGITDLSLTGTANLNAQLGFTGVTASGALEADFNWDLQVDHSTGQPSFSGLPQLDSVQAQNLAFVVDDIVRFDIAQVDYVPNPTPGDPVASTTGATITLLGVLADANVSGSADLDLYDDDGDGFIDGVALDQLELSFAPQQTWDYPAGSSPLLRVSDLTATLSGMAYRPALGGFQTQGSISLSAGEVALYPEGGGSFNASVSNATGSIDAVTGEVVLDLGELAIGLGPDSYFQVDVQSATFRLDASEATDILTVGSASLKVENPLNSLDAASFTVDNFRFNLVGGQPKFGIDDVTLDTPDGVLGTLGLSGFLPLDVTNAGLSFAGDGEGYTDFTNFVLSVDGYFNLGLLDSVLPFDPVLSIGPTSAGTAQTPNTFTDIQVGFDLASGLIEPINMSDITVGFENWEIGELVFAGEFSAAGYVNGVLQPTLSGLVGIDVNSANNQVAPSSGTGIDIYGAEIALSGTIDRTPGATSLVIDAQAGLMFDLSLGDFLQLSDLGFNFGLDVDVPDNFLDDPLGLVDVTPRLESMSVGTLTASAGDYLSFGAVPGSGGGPGLFIDFAPEADEPLATFNFNLQSPLIGLSGTVENLKILQGGVPDFNSVNQVDIGLVSRGDGSPSLLQDVFSEFLPLSISRIALAFQDGFFELEGPPGSEVITGIADPTKLNLITSGMAGVPAWFPDDFIFDIGSEFTNLELDLDKLFNGQFAIVDIGGLGFEAGIDVGAFKINGALAVGSVDADPGPGEEQVYYAAIDGELKVAGYGAAGTLAVTSAGPLGVTLAVPLAIPIAQTGFVITGAAGSIQFGTVPLPDPEDIQAPSDLGTIPNPFDIELTSPSVIEGIVQDLWVPDAGGGFLGSTWTEPVTLALQGKLTHVAVAKMLTGTATVAANLTLPIGGATIDDAGLALLGFGDIRVFDIPFAEAKVVFDLRDELNPSLGFYIQAPANGNPLGIFLPAQADFGALLRTDGLAMATAVGLQAFFTQLADGVLSQGQLFFENVAGDILDALQNSPADSALADLLSPLLSGGQTFADLTAAEFIALLRDSLEFDDVLAALGASGGQTVEELPANLQDKLSTVIALTEAAVADILQFAPQVIQNGLDDSLTIGEQLVAMGLRSASQQNDPVDPFGLLTSFGADNLAVSRTVPVEFISEFTSVMIGALGSAAADAFAQTAAFAASDSFDPRLLVEGSMQPTLLGVPVGNPPGSVQLSISKRGISFGLDASIIKMLKLIGTAPMGPLAFLVATSPDVVDQTTIAYELPFNSVEILQGLAAGELSLAALNPFSPNWGELINTQLQAITSDISLSMVQFGPGSGLLENNVQIVDDFDDPVQQGKIPVTSQELLDRMLDLGGFLLTGGITQAKLLTDPFEVILNIIDAANQAGEELETAEDEIQYLQQLFSTVPSFLEAVQDSLTEMEEYARIQAYLPISYATLLPQELQDLLDGDIESFNEAFLDTFFDETGAIREDAVVALLGELGSQIQDSASTIAANMYVEGLLNSKLLGIELANGRIFAGVLPDPDNPGQTIDFGNSAITVTGAIPWLGGLEVEAVLDQQLIDLPAPPTSGPDPLAALRAAFGDTYPLPRGSFELALDTNAPPDETSDFEKVLDNLGLDTSLFQLPTIGQADASLRAYTPGYDVTSSDVIQQIGGLEFLANLSIDNVVDSAAFSVRMTAPVVGPSGVYLPFTGNASVDEITLGGLTITDAELQLISDADGVRIGVKGDAEVLGAMFSVDGELDSSLIGNLTMTLKSGETLAGAFGGFSGSGSFTLVLNGPTDGSIAFTGSLSNVPGTGSSDLNVSGTIETNGDFTLSSSATNVSLGGFAINSAQVSVVKTGALAEVQFAGGATSVLGANFAVAGALSTAGTGSLNLSLDSGSPSFGGINASGSFALNVSGGSSADVSFVGTLSGVPGVGAALSVSGSIDENGDLEFVSSASNLSLGGFAINAAILRITRTAGIVNVAVEGSASTLLLGATFDVAGSLTSTGAGTLNLSLASGSPSFGGLTGSGSFSLVLNSATSGSVSFTGSLFNVPGMGLSSLAMNGSISSDGDFDVSSSATNLTLGGFLINSAIVTVERNGGTTNVSYAGTASMGLLGATFGASGSLSTTGSGTLTLTSISGTPSFGGLTGSGSFSLILSSATSGSVSFNGSLSGVPGKGSSSLSMSGNVFSSGNFTVSSSATNLALGGFGINSAIVTVTKSGSFTTVSYSGTASMGLLGATFRASGSLSTSGNGTLSLTKTSGTPSFGGLSASGSFSLVLSSATSGSVSFAGSLSGVPGKHSSSLSMSGSIFSSGNFNLTSSATNLTLGGFSINSVVVAITKSGSTTTVSFSGTASMSLLGANFRMSGSLSTSGNGTLSLTKTSGTPSFGGLSGNGSFSLVLSSPTSGSVSFSGTLSGVPGKGSSSLSMGGSVFSNGNFNVSSSATGVTLGGFGINSAIVTVSRSGSSTSVSYSGTASMGLLGASFRASGSLSTSGSGTLTLTKTSGTPSFGGLSASGSFSLGLSSATSGSVSFGGSVSNVPGKGSSSLSMSGSIFSSGNFSVSSSATGLTFGGFSINSAVVTVAKSGSTTNVSYSGTSSLSMLGANFRMSGSLSTSGNGTLSLTKTSGTPKFAGANASGTFSMSVSGGSSATVSFSGSVSSIPGGFVSSLSVSGSMSSPTSYSVSGSTSINKTVSIVGQPLARILGTFNLTLSSSGFSGSVTGATIQIRVFNPFSGQFEWQTLVSGTATINSNGTGSLGGYTFSY